MTQNKLNKMWEKATLPDIETLDGKYTVSIASGVGWLPAKFINTWTKIIYTLTTKDGFGCMPKGFNIVNHKKTGKFTVFTDLDNRCLELFYNNTPSNPKFWRQCKDYVRRVDDKALLGKIYFRFWKKYRFVGFFILTKIRQKNMKEYERI